MDAVASRNVLFSTKSPAHSVEPSPDIQTLNPAPQLRVYRDEPYTPGMRRTLSCMTRSLPLRVLAVVACWLMLSNSLWAYLPSAPNAGPGVMSTVTSAPVSAHASNKMHLAEDNDCCSGHIDHHMGHRGTTCHCASSCGGLLLPGSETASASIMTISINTFPLERRAPSLALQPPLRPPVV